MNFRKVSISVQMIFRALLRQKIVVLLVLFIPIFFLFIVEFTSSENLLPMTFPSIEGSDPIFLPERLISLIYYSIATCGFLVAFLSLYLIQQNKQANKRLVLCGYHPSVLLLAKLIVLIIIIISISLYVGVLTSFFHDFDNLTGLVLGLVLIGLVYGSYGLFIGSLLKRELEGILAIVLLVNIDVGWLQNPVFLTQSENQEFITYLPGHYPSQSTIIQVFTDYSTFRIDLFSILYAFIFLFLAIMMFYYRMRIIKTK